LIKRSTTTSSSSFFGGVRGVREYISFEHGSVTTVTEFMTGILPSCVGDFYSFLKHVIATRATALSLLFLLSLDHSRNAGHSDCRPSRRSSIIRYVFMSSFVNSVALRFAVFDHLYPSPPLPLLVPLNPKILSAFGLRDARKSVIFSLVYRVQEFVNKHASLVCVHRSAVRELPLPSHLYALEMTRSCRSRKSGKRKGKSIIIFEEPRV